MIATRIDYTFNEFLEMDYDDQTIGEHLRDEISYYSAFTALIDKIKGLYGEWFALSLLNSDPDHVKFWAIKTCDEMTAWFDIYAKNYQQLFEVLFDRNVKNVSRFNDTPESKGDYSSLEHTTTITSNETIQNDPISDFNRLKESYEIKLANAFRKRFLRWLGGDE